MSKTVVKKAIQLFDSDNEDEPQEKKSSKKKSNSSTEQRKRTNLAERHDVLLRSSRVCYSAFEGDNKSRNNSVKKKEKSKCSQSKVKKEHSEKQRRNVEVLKTLRTLKLEPEISKKLMPVMKKSELARSRSVEVEKPVFCEEDFAKFVREYVV